MTRAVASFTRPNSPFCTHPRKTAADAVEFAKFSLQLFSDVVLENKGYVDLIVGDVYKHQTYYMGLVDHEGGLQLYDGQIRVKDADGQQVAF